jgi:hypothetical protein
MVEVTKRSSTMPPKQQSNRTRSQQPAPTNPGAAATIRHGNLKCTLWRNEGDNGPWYVADLVRTFKDQSGFQETNKVPADDLLRVSFLAEQAYARLLELKAGDKAALAEELHDTPEPY